MKFRLIRSGRTPRVFAALIVASTLVTVSACASGSSSSGSSTSGSSDNVTVGIITRDATNPYWVAIADGAKKAAEKEGVTLISAVGKSDTDNASQISAIENMMTRGATTIMLTPVDDKAISPTIKKAQDAGVQVIALDSTVDAADATFATDHTNMGVLIGQWAKAKFAGKPMKIAMLDADPQSLPGVQRHDGFLKGYGITDSDPQIVGVANSHASVDGGLSAMETLLQKDPSINLVFTVNEPAGFGAYQALEKAGLTDKVTLLTLDGGCKGIDFVKAGKFAADTQQYPGLMSEKGIEAAIEFAKSGTKAKGFVDTGEKLVTGDPVSGVTSISIDDAAANCWGSK